MRNFTDLTPNASQTFIVEMMNRETSNNKLILEAHSHGLYGSTYPNVSQMIPLSVRGKLLVAPWLPI